MITIYTVAYYEIILVSSSFWKFDKKWQRIAEII